MNCKMLRVYFTGVAVLEAHACLAHMDYTAKRLSRFKELVEQTLLLVFFFCAATSHQKFNRCFFQPNGPNVFQKTHIKTRANA